MSNKAQTVASVVNTVSTDDSLSVLKQSMNLKRLYTYYRCAMMEVETKFHVLNEEFSLMEDRNPIETIKCRLKSLSSLMSKMDKKNLSMSVENIYENIFDVAGIRVICSFEDDVYEVCNALLKQDDITLIEMKDYIKEPKDNGYRSLHVIVSVPIFLAKEKMQIPVEIQFRTIAMDFWASLEHQIRYKKEIKNPEVYAAPLKACADLSAALDSSMNSLRKEIASQQKDDDLT